MDDKLKSRIDSATRIHLEKTFELITLIETSNNFKIKSNYPTIDGLILTLVKGDRCFKLETGFINPVKEPVQYQHDGYGYFKPFELINEDFKLNIPIGVSKLNMMFGEGKSDGEITEINSGIESDKTYYGRAVIPIKYSPNKIPLKYLESEAFAVGASFRPLGLVTTKINDNKFYFFDYRFNKQYYFIIESQTLLKPEDFENHINSILYSFALISGFLPRNEIYLFYSKTDSFNDHLAFEYRKIQETIDSRMEVISPDDLREIERQKGNQVSRLDSVIKSNIFSNLTTIVFNDSKVLRALSIITEGNVYPLEIRAATYLVALETIKNIIIEKNEDKITPIKDKPVSKQLIKDMKLLIEKLSPSVFNNKAAIIARVENINQITNTDSIYKIFELMKMELNDDDKECLAKRNDFLHGKVPFESELLYKHSKELQHITYKVHFLLTSLILKCAGYSGFVKNNPKYFDVFVAKRDIDEPLFRKI